MHLYVQSNEIYLLSFFIHGKQLVHPSCILIACVASVSNRVIARKLEREQKKVEGGGGGEKRKRLPVSFVPLPLPLHSLFLLSSQLSRRTRTETLATEASPQVQ